LVILTLGFGNHETSQTTWLILPHPLLVTHYRPFVEQNFIILTLFGIRYSNIL
jgi:hypothetical protein